MSIKVNKFTLLVGASSTFYLYTGNPPRLHMGLIHQPFIKKYLTDSENRIVVQEKLAEIQTNAIKLLSFILGK